MLKSTGQRMDISLKMLSHLNVDISGYLFCRNCEGFDLEHNAVQSLSNCWSILDSHCRRKGGTLNIADVITDGNLVLIALISFDRWSLFKGLSE